jgi:hypothetical protein
LIHRTLTAMCVAILAAVSQKKIDITHISVVFSVCMCGIQ